MGGAKGERRAAWEALKLPGYIAWNLRINNCPLV